MTLEYEMIEMTDVYSRMHYDIRQGVDAHSRSWYTDELTAIQTGKQSGLEVWRVYCLPERGYTVVEGYRGGHDMAAAQLCIRYVWCSVQCRYRQA